MAIMGATASGKSSLALELAECLNGEIVNADALQVYRGLDIGTAKPSQADRTRVPHHLVDILEPSEQFSAGAFARLARQVIKEIDARGKQVFLVGGSGFYLKALLDGISPVPGVDPAIREGLRHRLQAEGLTALRSELESTDPESASRIDAGDSQRISRALEVIYGTGVPLSKWQSQKPSENVAIDSCRIGLTLPRALLYDRIALRVRAMIRAGWVDEVKTLLDLGLSPDLPAFQAIGYRQLVTHLLESSPLEGVVEEIIGSTRRYAKRQLTWFRNDPRISWFSAEEEWVARDRIMDYLMQEFPGGNDGQA